MADDISIVLKMTEDVSGTMKSISSASRGVSKEFEALQRQAQQLGQRYTAMNKKAAEASAEALSVGKAMTEARKALNKTQSEADKANYEKLKAQYDDLKYAAKGYATAAKETVRDMNDVARTVRKLDDQSRAGALGSFWGRITDDRLRSGLMASGLGSDLSNSISGFLGSHITSAIGQPMATAIGEGISGTISGIAAGSFAGIPGMVVGGGIGLLSGIMNGQSKIFEARDAAFKDYYKSLYETGETGTAEGLSAGRTLAASRETTKLSFSTLLGSEQAAGRFLEDVLKTANTTPFLYDDLTGISKTLLSFGYAMEDIIPTLTKVGDAGAALGLSTADIGTVATYIGRMRSSDKASLEYLNPLNERGLGVFEWLAQDLGISQKAVYDKISKGELSGEYVSELLLERFESLYGGMMEVQSRSTEGLDSTLQGLMENIQAAGGDAYNEAMKASKNADIAAYGGTLGDKLAELNAISGQVDAYGESLRSQYQREALGAVLEGKGTTVFSQEDQEALEGLRTEFQAAQAAWEAGDMLAGQTMTNLRESAEAVATAAFESSGWSQRLHDAELDQIEATRQLTASMDAATRAWETGNAFSKGMNISRPMEYNQNAVNDSPSGLYKDLRDPEPYVSSIFRDVGNHAFGLKRVPIDGYPALLHQGERVLTAEEVRRQSRGNGSGLSVTITGPVSVRQDSDIDAIAMRLADEIEARALSYGG